MVNNTLDPVSTTMLSFDIIEYIHSQNGATITDVANDMDLVKSTAHRHLSTLRSAGWLVREGTTFYLSIRFLALGKQAQNRKPEYEIVKPRVSHIAAETGERSQFIVEENGSGVYVHTALGEHAVRTDSGEGKQVPLNTISAGKAILSQMPESRVVEIIDSGKFAKNTKNTITDKGKIFQEINKIRELGYAVNEGESTEGLRAVSVPVTAPDGGILGALGVSGPARRMNPERIENDIVDLLLGVVNEIELDIEYV